MSTTSFSQFVFQPWLTPARFASETNIVGAYFNGNSNNGVGATLILATGVLTIDSGVVNFGDRVLLAAQTASEQNGVYICTQEGAVGVAAILQRAADFQCVEQMKPGFYISIFGGTLYNGSIYTFVEPAPALVGVDPILFTSSINAGNTVHSTVPTIVNYVAVYSDVVGNITESYPVASFVRTTVSNQMGGGTAIHFNASSGTVTANTITLNSQAGVINSAALTTAGGAAYTFTFTNSIINANSVVVLQDLSGGTNTTANYKLQATTGASGSCTVTITNLTAATALNGSILIGFLIT